MFFLFCVFAVILILSLAPPSKKRKVFVPTLCLAAVGAAYAIYEFALAFGPFPGRWVVVLLLFGVLLVNAVFVYRVTKNCTSCGFFAAVNRRSSNTICPRCGVSYETSDRVDEKQDLLLSQPAAEPDMPAGFRVEVHGSTRTIDHVRTGMKAQNVFLGFCCAFWTFGCGMVAKEYLTGKQASVLPFVLMSCLWCVLVLYLLYFLFCKKRFILNEHALEVETNVLGIHRRQQFAKNSICGLRQLKALSQSKKNSFPSWGLEIKTIEPEGSWYVRLRSLFRSARTRYRCLLYQLPYEQSAWLGALLSEWASVPLSLCPKPESAG